jgi:uncharacterized delta-60 repeat protein
MKDKFVTAHCGSPSVSIERLEDRRLLSFAGLDPSFGSGGKVRTDFATGAEFGTNLTIDSSGRLYVCGWLNNQFSLMRYTPSGALDTSFGGGKGYVQPPLPSGYLFSQGESVLVQSDGKILLGGTYFGAQATAVGIARFTSSGQLDTTWAASGQETVPFESGTISPRMSAMALQADGKLVIAASTGASALVRLNTDGSIDSTFDQSGPHQTNMYSNLMSVAIQSDGKIVMLGGRVVGGTAGFLVGRVNADGTPDTTFDSDGSNAILINGASPDAQGMSVLPDGRILTIGSISQQVSACCFNSDGSPDLSFGTNGATQLLGGAWTKAFDVGRLSDGRIVIAGSYASGTRFTTDFSMWVLKPDGTPDTSVGAGGKVTTDFGGDDEAEGLIVQADGKVVLAGWTQRSDNSSDVVLARYLGASSSPSTGGSISGSIFNDGNNNAERDSGEAGVAGITVYNDANNNSKLDAGELTTVTDPNGVYVLGNLASGSYKIREILQSGWGQTTPANNYGWTITLATNQQLTGKDFGTKQTNVTPPPTGGSIAGVVYDDANGNAKRDAGELGVAGTTIYNDANNNSKLDSGEATTVTDANGAYALSNLAAGSYKIREILQTGWVQTTPAKNYGWTLTLASNQNLTGKDFGTEQIGVTPPPPSGGSIAGTVFNDLDGDRVKDSNEVGVADITVYNDANNNSKLDAGEKTTLTDASGDYILSGLSSGSYKIREILQSGWSQTTPTNNYGWTISLASNQNLTGKNFGTKQSNVATLPTGGKISGTIFNDLDGDGKKDSNEVGVGSAWTVYIDLDNDSVLDLNEVFTSTDASGNWTLSGSPPARIRCDRCCSQDGSRRHQRTTTA